MNKRLSMSEKEALIARLILNQGETYGYDMIKLSEGKLNKSSLYIYLTRMKDKGYLSCITTDDEVHPGLKKRYYRLTGLGQKTLELWEMMNNQDQMAMA